MLRLDFLIEPSIFLLFVAVVEDDLREGNVDAVLIEHELEFPFQVALYLEEIALFAGRAEQKVDARGIERIHAFVVGPVDKKRQM